MQRNFGALFGPTHAVLARTSRHFFAIERNIARRTLPRACPLKRSANPHSHSRITVQMSIFMQ
jgi:hypothetical protein